MHWWCNFLLQTLPDRLIGFLFHKFSLEAQFRKSCGHKGCFVQKFDVVAFRADYLILLNHASSIFPAIPVDPTRSATLVIFYMALEFSLCLFVVRHPGSCTGFQTVLLSPLIDVVVDELRNDAHTNRLAIAEPQRAAEEEGIGCRPPKSCSDDDFVVEPLIAALLRRPPYSKY